MADFLEAVFFRFAEGIRMSTLMPLSKLDKSNCVTLIDSLLICVRHNHIQDTDVSHPGL